MVQCLRLSASNTGDAGSIPGQGSKIPPMKINKEMHQAKH